MSRRARELPPLIVATVMGVTLTIGAVMYTDRQAEAQQDTKRISSVITASCAETEAIQTEIQTETQPEPETETERITERPVPVEETENERFSQDERYMLMKLAMAEAEGESTEGKALVMNVVLNRIESSDFPNSVAEVIFESGQFSSVANGGRYYGVEPDADCEKALQMVLDGWDESRGALYFESCTGESWHSANLEFLFQVGGHRFYR